MVRSVEHLRQRRGRRDGLADHARLSDQGPLPDAPWPRRRRRCEGVRARATSTSTCSTTSRRPPCSRSWGVAASPTGAPAQVANVLCVGSGKGGVGKSTLTANLAAALAGEGKRVGILDADVWGYSIPRMYGLGATRPPVSAQRKILPLEAHGVKVMSIGFFVAEDAAVVWRGPMLHKALTQFLQDVDWGALDHLLIDLPPGTGDVSMTLAQLLPQAQLRDRHHPSADRPARRAPRRRDGRTRSPSRSAGSIENMSGFTTPSGERFPDLRRGRRPGAGGRARRAPAGQGPADDAPARARRRRRPAGDRGPRRSRLPGDPPRGARSDRDGRSRGRCRTARRPCCRSPARQLGADAPVPALGAKTGRYVTADGLRAPPAARTPGRAIAGVATLEDIPARSLDKQALQLRGSS